MGLREHGYLEGKNILIQQRYAEGKLDQMPALVNELVQQKVDVIFATNNVVIQAAKKVTKTIPIVMVSSWSIPLLPGMWRASRVLAGILLDLPPSAGI